MPYSVMDEINREIPPAVGKKYGSSALLTAYGCVLLEQETAGRMCYRAVNLSTGQVATLGRRLTPVTATEIKTLIEKLYNSPVSGPGRYGVDMPPGEKLLPEKLDEILAHIFECVLPEFGFARRPSQIELARQILGALCKRSITLSEAEVGTGKTHAYLIAAILVKRSRVNDFWLRMSWPKQGYAESAYMPVVLTTSSIALQQAIVRDYIPEISTILEQHRIIQTPVTSVLRKGKEHYICERNLRAFYRQTERANQELLHPLMENSTVDLGEAKGLTPYIKRHICVPGRCDYHCPQYMDCRFQNFLKQAQSSRYDFQVCNHNYLLADTLHRAKGLLPLIPHYQGIVIDEAHKLLTAARQMYGTSLQSGVLVRLAGDLRSFTYKKGSSGKNALDMADKLAGQSKRLFQLLAAHIPQTDRQEESERFSTEIDSQAVKHLKNIKSMASGLAYILKENTVLPHYTGRKEQMLWQLQNTQEQACYLLDHTALVYWLETSENAAFSEPEYTLCAIPKGLGALLHQDIWNKSFPVVLTSGTLSASGSFTHMKKGLGLDEVSPQRLMEATHPSPFDHKNHAMLYISQSVPFPNTQDKKYLRAVADETEKLIIAAHGHTAVLFTSYKAMGIVYNDLSRRSLPYPFYRMDKGHTAALEGFRASGNGVLFASGALWEGIDLPGDILSMLVIVKLPFAVPDPINEYERTLYPNMAAYKSAVMVPDMIVKLKQGFGRLIRSETDTGVVALLDSRVQEGKPYNRRVLAALPPCRITSEIEDVEQFYKTHKETEYFT